MMMTPIKSSSPALPDVRPAPQAGCFVSRLYASYESRVACDSFAFGTVMVAPSSGVSEPAEQAKARAELKSKGACRFGYGSAEYLFHAGRALHSPELHATLLPRNIKRSGAFRVPQTPG